MLAVICTGRQPIQQQRVMQADATHSVRVCLRMVSSPVSPATHRPMHDLQAKGMPGGTELQKPAWLLRLWPGHDSDWKSFDVVEWYAQVHASPHIDTCYSCCASNVLKYIWTQDVMTKQSEFCIDRRSRWLVRELTWRGKQESRQPQVQRQSSR